MLLFTISFGGLLLMMGHQSRSEALFYYFRLEDQVPENHLLRLIDRHVNFGFIRARLKDAYSDAGRPSIDPELLLRLLLVGYLYGVTSERKLVEERLRTEFFNTNALLQQQSISHFSVMDMALLNSGRHDIGLATRPQSSPPRFNLRPRQPILQLLAK